MKERKQMFYEYIYNYVTLKSKTVLLLDFDDKNNTETDNTSLLTLSSKLNQKRHSTYIYNTPKKDNKLY